MDLLLCFQIQFYLQLFKLFSIDSAWSIYHHISAAIVFWKCNKVTYTFASAKDRTKSVETKCYTTMRRSTVFKST